MDEFENLSDEARENPSFERNDEPQAPLSSYSHLVLSWKPSNFTQLLASQSIVEGAEDEFSELSKGPQRNIQGLRCIYYFISAFLKVSQGL